MNNDSGDEQANSHQKSWLNKITFALTGEPKDRHELINFIRDAANRDLIDNDILNMFEGVLKLQELRARDVMIPRTQIVTIEEDISLNEIINLVVTTGHSRFPVSGDNKDKIKGILLAKDLLAYINIDAKLKVNFCLSDIIRPALFVPESKRLGSLLHEFQTKRTHIAVVIDEYGGVTGLLTIEDVIEQIVGEIEDEYDIDDSEPLIKQIADDTFTIRAITPIEEFNNFFQTNLTDKDAETVGGLLLRELGRMPKKGEVIILNNFSFKILRADSRRIYLLEINAKAATVKED